jgi:hypothetical protein
MVVHTGGARVWNESGGRSTHPQLIRPRSQDRMGHHFGMLSARQVSARRNAGSPDKESLSGGDTRAYGPVARPDRRPPSLFRLRFGWLEVLETLP